MQTGLFKDNVFDAVRSVVAALGGAKIVGCQLRPEKAADEAARWLNKCLDDGAAEKLDLDQLLLILRMGREANCHIAMGYICEVAGYEAKPVEPEDTRAQLQREFTQGVKLMSQLAARMERAGMIDPHGATISKIGRAA